MFKSEEGDIKMVLETTNNKNDEVNIDQYMIHGHEDAIGSSDSLQDESKDNLLKSSNRMCPVKIPTYLTNRSLQNFSYKI